MPWRQYEVIAHDDFVDMEVTLLGIEPRIWRRLHVPAVCTLAHLHDILQIAFGWTNSHLHSFDVDGIRFIAPDFEDESFAIDENAAPLGVFAREGARILYTYDFGDSWEHDIALLGVVEGDSPSLRCVGGERSGPPEDSGGIGGYMDLCAILADRRHPEYAQMRTWVGKGFDPEKIDLVAINRHLAALAKRAARPAGPAKKPRRARASAR